jgi:hypothetical protein
MGQKKKNPPFLEAGLYILNLNDTSGTASGNRRNNNDHHNKEGEGQNIICSAFQHEDQLYCEYTNRLLKHKIKTKN